MYLLRDVVNGLCLCHLLSSSKLNKPNKNLIIFMSEIRTLNLIDFELSVNVLKSGNYELNEKERMIKVWLDNKF